MGISMAIHNWDRFHANIQEMKSGKDHIGKGERKAKLTRAERRAKVVKEHSARQSWRNYDNTYMSYFSVVFTEALVSVFAVLFYSLFIFAFVVGVLGLAMSSYMLGILIFGGVFAVIITPHTRRLIKRYRFMRRLAKYCKKNGLRLYRYSNSLRSLYRHYNVSDFAVETREVVYECMFFPAPRKLSILRFDKPGEVCLVTGILRNRFKEVLGMHEKVRVRPFGFEPNTRSTTKQVRKVVLLNPVPYELYYFDKKDGKTVQGGSGTEFYDYVAYSGSGFINTLDRG